MGLSCTLSQSGERPGCLLRSAPCLICEGAPLRRREFITLLGGAAVGLPLAASAQQPVPVIGFLHQGSQEPLYNMTAFKEGLREIGIIEGQNAAIEDRAADGHYDRLPALAADLVQHRPAAIAANFLPMD
jgi:putative tryptophan/tyrosine transport system substrate-binding protein